MRGNVFHKFIEICMETLQVPWELHFIRQQHRQRGVYQNWSGSSGVQETEQHLEVHNSQYQNQAQNLPVQCTFNSSLRLRDVENQQEVGEQTSGLGREMFTENIESYVARKGVQ